MSFGDSEARYRTLLDHLPAVIYVEEVDRAGRTVHVSPRVEAMLGYRPEEWLAEPQLFTGLLHPEDREHVLAQSERTKANGESYVMEYRLIARAGRSVWVRDEAMLVREECGCPPYWQGAMTDVTERKTLEERLRHQALYDYLTDLPNRDLLIDRLENALVRAEGRGKLVAVLFLDLDNFKHVNDSLGHEAGDRLLVEVAAQLREGLPAGDTIARLGGDEFVVLHESLDSEREVDAVAERIAQTLRPTMVLGEHEVFVTASIGVTFGGSREDRPAVLLREADVAMYRAKARGKGRYEVFSPEMGEALSRRFTLERDLRWALEREELAVHYQPKVLIETGEIVGMETLARWEHPQPGLLAPAEFLPLAEETGLVVSLGRSVLGEACRQARAWQRLYPSRPPLALYVNLSAREFHEPNLVAQVSEVLRESGLEASYLVLEITEGTAMEDTPSTVATLRALKELGVQLAIDDFGKGYSSLSYLKRFPVDIIKIDRSIVEGLGQERGNSAIVSAALTLAHAIDLEVIAEGMETREEVAELRALGCKLGQGFYWWTPQPAREMAALLEAHASVGWQHDGFWRSKIMSIARRAAMVLALVAAMATMTVMAGAAFADPPPQANASCFGKSESADQGRPGPGEEVSSIATTLARSHTTPVAAQLVPALQEATHTVCQGNPTP